MLRKATMIVAALAGFGLAMLVICPAGADAAHSIDAADIRPMPATDFSAQSRYRVRRARTRIEVYPARNFYRRCIDWYALERRPSGDVVVPRMRCWWVRG